MMLPLHCSKAMTRLDRVAQRWRPYRRTFQPFILAPDRRIDLMRSGGTHEGRVE